MFAPSTEFYEKQKRIYERLSELERERLDVEQQISSARIGIQTSLTNDDAGIERLKKNVRDSKTKIEENREIMRHIDRVILRVDAALDDCEYLDSLKNTMLDYAKEAYERWYSEDPKRAERFWKERAERMNQTAPSLIESKPSQERTVVTKSPSATDKLNLSTSSTKLDNSLSEVGAAKSSPKKGKSPRFNEHVEVAVYEQDLNLDSPKQNNLEQAKSVPEQFLSAREESDLNATDFADSSKIVPSDAKMEEVSPQEFFSARSEDSKKVLRSPRKELSFDLESKVSRSDSEQSFSEKRSLDQQNELFLDAENEKTDVNFSLDKKRAGNDEKLGLNGLQSLIHRIEDGVMDDPDSCKYLYNRTNSFENLDVLNLVEKANSNKLEDISAVTCGNLIMQQVKSMLKSCMFKSMSPSIDSFEDLNASVSEENRKVYELFRDHLKFLAVRNAVPIDVLTSTFSQLFAHRIQDISQLHLILSACLEKSLEEYSETSISAFSTPRVNGNATSTPRKPILKNSTGSLGSLKSSPEHKSASFEVAAEVKRDVSIDKHDDEDSFPFTSQSLEDHLDISLQSGAVEKTSNAYQSLLKNAFGAKGHTELKESKSLTDEDDDIEGLFGSTVDVQKEDKKTSSSASVTSGGKTLYKSKHGSPKKVLSPRSSADKSSSGGEEDLSSGSRGRAKITDITAGVRSSLGRSSPRKAKLESANNYKGRPAVSSVALRDFGDIDDDEDEVYEEDFNEEMGNSSVTDLLGITPRDKHLDDGNSDDSDFFT